MLGTIRLIRVSATLTERFDASSNQIDRGMPSIPHVRQFKKVFERFLAGVNKEVDKAVNKLVASL